MWDQAELGFEGVIAIAGELINEHAILERCPENIGGNNPCNGDKGPIRAHDKRPSEEHNQGACVHGMPDESIRS